MSPATKPLMKLPTPALAVAWVVLITARVVIFNEGGSLGAYVVVVAFSLMSAVLAIQSVVLLISGEGRWEQRVILIALAAFFFPQISGQGLAARICFVTFLVAVLSLIVIYLRRLRTHGHHAVGQ
jgi:hypothetical protein